MVWINVESRKKGVESNLCGAWLRESWVDGLEPPEVVVVEVMIESWGRFLKVGRADRLSEEHDCLIQ
jgi:hypothetical protein